MSTNKKTVLSILVFLFFIYPMFHNIILYFMEILFQSLSLNLKYVTIVILGWKDPAIIFLSSILLFKRKNFFTIFFIFIASFYTLATQGVLFTKEIIIPFLITSVLLSYQKDIAAYTRSNFRKINITTNVALFLILIVGFSDLFYRDINKIDSSSWSEHSYLVANNSYKCVKYEILGDFDIVDRERCLSSKLNFYKLDFDNGEYKALKTLFLPIGDSVTTAFLLLYILCWRFIKTLFYNKLTWFDVIFIIAIVASIFATYNRFSSLAVVMLVSFFLLNGVSKNIKKLFAIFIGVAFSFIIKSHYLLYSIFNFEIPSNIGHVKAVSSIVGSGDWTFELFLIIIIIMSVLIVIVIKMSVSRGGHRVFWIVFSGLYVVIAFNFNIPLSVFGGGVSTLPTESNFIKALAVHGIAGAVIYMWTLSNMLKPLRISSGRGNIGGFLKNAYYRSEFSGRSIAVFTVLILFIYQLISPYVISGYVVFAPGIFIGIIFPCLLIDTKGRGLRHEKKTRDGGMYSQI
jgi:hypothetical protein